MTAVDNAAIDNIKMDTDRDGIDLISRKNVRISNCSVNTPSDDAIVLKSDYALNYPRATENITITNCQVFGYNEGTFFPISKTINFRVSYKFSAIPSLNLQIFDH